MQKNNFTIITLSPPWLPRVAALERECFARPWSMETLMGEMNNPRSRFLLAVAGHQLAAYGSMQQVLDEGYINNIATSPRFRRQGAARQILRALVSLGEEGGVRFLTLEVRESNQAARALYEEEGFAVQGVRRGFYESPKEDALIMTRYLKEENLPAKEGSQ